MHKVLMGPKILTAYCYHAVPGYPTPRLLKLHKRFPREAFLFNTAILFSWSAGQTSTTFGALIWHNDIGCSVMLHQK